MKKKIILVLSLMMIFSAMLCALPASAEEVKRTSDIVVDTNVFKGDYVQDDNDPLDSVIVWGYVKEGKYDDTCEYGNFIYVACKDSDIDLSKGVFNPAEAGKDRFATRFERSKFKKGVEYAVKTYEKDAEGVVKLSRKTAFFNVNDAELKTFDPYIHGANIVYADQDSESNYAKDQVNTQYFVYRDDVLLGATNEFGFNVVDDLFDQDGNFDATSYNITIKTVSGLNNGGQSNPYTFEMQEIDSEVAFMSIGTDVDTNQGPQNFYYVLTTDINLTEGVTYKTGVINDSSWKPTNTLQYIIKYFADTLDGRGHKISVKYDLDSQAQDGSQLSGLFGKFCESGFVRNLYFEADLKYNINQTGSGGERAAAFALIGAGSYENCVLKAKMQNLDPKTNPNVNIIRRDAFIGFPGNYIANNVLAELYLTDEHGQLIGDVKQHDSAESHYGTHFHWESMHTPEANNLIMVAPVTMGTNYSVGPYKGRPITYYNTMADVLNGNKGIILDQEGLSSMDKGDYLSGYAYTNGWDSDIWEFNKDGKYIKFFGTVIHQGV